jgi:hypothetical protein
MTSRHVKRIDELGKEIPPPRDLWPAIAQAIQEDLTMQAVPDSRRHARWLPAVGLAASVVLVAVGVLIGRQLGSTTPGTLATNTTTHTDGAVIPAALMRDAEYRKQRSELMTQVEAKLKTMPQAEREKVAGSLATLQRSIQEIEAALGHDPANALLQELLVTSCQEEMRALTVVRDSGHQET